MIREEMPHRIVFLGQKLYLGKSKSYVISAYFNKKRQLVILLTKSKDRIIAEYYDGERIVELPPNWLHMTRAELEMWML